MDCQRVGALIADLRKEKAMTQKNLADLLHISDKTVSKWERGLGCPDISLLSQLSAVLAVDIEKILQGDIEAGQLVGGNMKKLKFYFCPTCGNLISSTGSFAASCCGRKLSELAAQKADQPHLLHLEPVEDEWFITSDHAMTKEHYISFIALTTGDKLVLVKQYPEWGLQLRLPQRGHGKLFYHCSQHGLFYRLL